MHRQDFKVKKKDNQFVMFQMMFLKFNIQRRLHYKQENTMTKACFIHQSQKTSTCWQWVPHQMVQIKILLIYLCKGWTITFEHNLRA